MPHLILEYTDNVAGLPPLRPFFTELHQSLAATEAVPLQDLKARAILHTQYMVGAGGQAAFVALTFKLLGGRDVSVRQRLLQVCTQVLSKHFAAAQQSGACQMSVEVVEMERSTYSKQWHPPTTDKGPLP